MNKKSRTRLTAGIIAVTVLMVGLVLYVDYSYSQYAAQKAEISAESYSVGIDYTGQISEQFIEEGDSVKSGQTLFYVKSNVLQERMEALDIEESQLLYPLNDDGEIIIVAPKDGVVSNIDYTKGSFVPANKELAQIISTESIYAVATYRMPQRDFAKINSDTVMTVTLPNGSTSSGTVANVSVIEQDDAVVTEVQTRLNEVDASSFISATGTPVEATIVLDERTLYSQFMDRVQTFGAYVQRLADGL